MLDARPHTAWDLTASPPWDGGEPAEQLADQVERGSVVLARVVEAVEAMQAQRERIERLADQLEEIGAFSGAIKKVADKTKLLALNATIEAARAGAQGAAFRVVADEIGSLAADTEAQTRRVSGGGAAPP